MRLSTKKISIGIILYVILLCLIASGLASCSTSKGLKTSSRSAHDSAAASNTTAAAVKSSDSLSTQKKDSSYNNNLVLVFDNDSPAAGQTAEKSDLDSNTAEPANDYEAAEKKPKKIVPDKKPGQKASGRFVYKINGNTIESPSKLKSATIQNNGHVEQVNISQVKSVDSNRSTAVTAVTVHDEKNIVSKEKRSSGLPWYVWFLLIAILLAAALYVLRRFKII